MFVAIIVISVDYWVMTGKADSCVTTADVY